MTHFLEVMQSHVKARVKNIHIHEQGLMDVVDFCSIFHDNDKPVVIAEVKLSSPSRGVIYRGASKPVDIAMSYMTCGASALSILTEPHFFNGNIQTIRDIQVQQSTIPILLKDFILSPIQIQQAYYAGASAVLLIVGFLTPSLLCALYEYAVSLGLTPLVEVHDEYELEQALSLKAKVIGINNRNLKTLKIDLKVTERLIRHIPDDLFVVCESGITSLSEMNVMQQLGCDGFLIGSNFMQSHHPGQALVALLKGEPHAR